MAGCTEPSSSKRLDVYISKPPVLRLISQPRILHHLLFATQPSNYTTQTRSQSLPHRENNIMTQAKETLSRQLGRQFCSAYLVNVLTWGLSAGVSIYYTIREPQDVSIIGARIWDQNFKYETGLTIDSNMVITYWAVIYAAQFVYMLLHIFQRSNHLDCAAIGYHFSANNLLHALFLVLFVRSAFGWAEGILILNFANLSVLYFQQNGLWRFDHILLVCAPLAWNFVAIFWNWGIAVTAHLGYNSAIEGFDLFFIWGILGYGVFSLLVFQVSLLYTSKNVGYILTFLVGSYYGLILGISLPWHRCSAAFSPS
ncbi:hypothetical protein J3459_010282 [Metarhizium acridum]|nr:hypothetical protein J3459_010282 [Metarhizium acridum]